MVNFDTYFRRISLLLPILLLIFVTSASAQGLFGVGLPGLPSFGGCQGGPGGCGEKLCPSIGAPILYVGWMEDRNGTSFTASTDGIGLLGLRQLTQHYRNRGTWFGVSGSVCLTDYVSFLASGWYLVPSNVDSRETFNEGFPNFPITGQSWRTDTQWWWVDGLFAIGPKCGPGTLLLGLRYDYFTTRFKDPPFNRTTEVLDLIGDQADVTSQAWIPLIGVQTAYESPTCRLVARVVGFPTLLGRVKYDETILATTRLESSGNYNNNFFLEVFSEYARKFGPGEIGVFCRWNIVQGSADLDTDLLPGLGSQKYKLSLTRTAWTLGASFNLAFDSPL